MGPDEPFGGGIPGTDFPVADADTTGQMMQFNVVPALAPDPTTPPQFLQLPAIAPLPQETVIRPLALIEKSGMGTDADGNSVEGPVEAVLGTIGPDAIDPTVGAGVWTERLWMEPVTENPAVGTTEIWEFYNTTADAHPMQARTGGRIELLRPPVDMSGFAGDAGALGPAIDRAAAEDPRPDGLGPVRRPPTKEIPIGSPASKAAGTVSSRRR